MKETVMEIVQNILQIHNDKIELLNTSDLRTLGMNSITAVQIIIELENAYGIEFCEDDYLLEAVSSIDKIVELLEKHDGAS